MSRQGKFALSTAAVLVCAALLAGSTPASAGQPLNVAPAVYRTGDGQQANVQQVRYYRRYGYGGGYGGGYYRPYGYGYGGYRPYAYYGPPVYRAPIYAPPVYGYPAYGYGYGYPAYGYGYGYPAYGYGAGVW